MRKMIGYVKCPICNGEGKHTTKASDYEILEAERYNSMVTKTYISCGASPLKKLKFIPEPEYQTCTKCKGEMVLPIYEEKNDDCRKS